MRPCLFLDLDSLRAEDARVVADWVRLCNELEIAAILLSGRGSTRRGLSRVDIERLGARIDDAYYCPHDTAAACACRLPRHGLLLQAGLRWNVDTKHSILVGDPRTGAEPAAKLGLRFVSSADVTETSLMPAMAA